MTHVHIDKLGDRVRKARFVAPNGREYDKPLDIKDVVRGLTQRGETYDVAWLSDLEADCVDHVPAATVLALSRVLGCSLLYLLGVEDG